MRIGIDVRSLEDGAQHRGIGRYATNLIEALSTIDHQNEYVFFVSSPKAKQPTFTLHPSFSATQSHGRRQSLRHVKYIRIAYLMPKPLAIDRFGLDVFFQLDLSRPVVAKKTPVVLVLYDLIPYIYKDIYQYVHFSGYTPGRLIGYSRVKLHWRIMERWQQKYAKAAKVVSISEHSKRDLLRLVPAVKRKNVVAIPLAAGNIPHVDAKAVKHMENLGLKKFIFYVGGGDPRKGLVNLAESMEHIWQKYPDTQLVLAGKELVDTEVSEVVRLGKAIKKLSRPKQVTVLGFISDGELAWLYAHAQAFVFPSRYEGFGLPVLEAMQAGCPVIAYGNSSIPEVAGDAAILVKDGDTMVPAINKVLGSAKLRETLIQKGLKQAARFTWEETAKRTLEVLESAATKRKRT